MIARGVQNADAVIQSLNKALSDLGEKAKPEWQASMKSIIATFKDMKGKFFIKTNFAIPATNAVLKDATEVGTLAANGDLAKFPEALARLQTSVDNLVKRSKMDGVSLT